jgi:hypothetical protein
MERERERYIKREQKERLTRMKVSRGQGVVGDYPAAQLKPRSR